MKQKLIQKRLPKFKSEEEEARFWDTHSPLDYPNEFTKVKVPPKFARLLKKRVKEDKKLLKRLASS